MYKGDGRFDGDLRGKVDGKSIHSGADGREGDGGELL